MTLIARRTLSSRVGLLFVFVGLAQACGTEDPLADTGADASPPDASSPDASSPDASSPDGSHLDASADAPSADASAGNVPLRVATLSAGAGHFCAILTGGSLKCWGAGNLGALGLGDTEYRGPETELRKVKTKTMGSALPAVNLGTGRTAVSTFAGFQVSCAVLDNGDLKCWGRNDYGQLGLGNKANQGDGPNEMGDVLSPISLGTNRRARQVASSVTNYNPHTCAVLDNGSVKCWGTGSAGALGLGDTADRGDDPNEMGDALPPVSLGSGRYARVVLAGSYFTCALLDDGKVKCWGSGQKGALGTGDTAIRGDQPGEMGDALPSLDFGTGRTATAITLGEAFGCALLDNGSVKCWGENTYGQLGLGDTADRGDQPGEMGDALAAVNLGTGRTAKAIGAGRSYACALLDDATVKCWGSNSVGELGQGDTTRRGDKPGTMGDAIAAIKFGTGRKVLAMAIGSADACVLLDDKSVKCWGSLGFSHEQFKGDDPGEMGDALPTMDLAGTVAPM